MQTEWLSTPDILFPHMQDFVGGFPEPSVRVGSGSGCISSLLMSGHCLVTDQLIEWV